MNRPPVPHGVVAHGLPGPDVEARVLETRLPATVTLVAPHAQRREAGSAPEPCSTGTAAPQARAACRALPQRRSSSTGSAYTWYWKPFPPVSSCSRCRSWTTAASLG